MISDGLADGLNLIAGAAVIGGVCAFNYFAVVMAFKPPERWAEEARPLARQSAKYAVAIFALILVLNLLNELVDGS